MIIRLRFVLVIFFVISVPTVFFFWFDGDEESSDVTFTDRQGRVYESSLALQLSENNYTDVAQDAVFVAARSFDPNEVVVEEVYQHSRTQDYYVKMQDGSTSVVIIVRNGKNYAFTVNSSEIRRCYTYYDSPYCS